jgi:hypothetical protein
VQESYELGEMLSSVLKQMRSLLGKAADAAQSWAKTSDRDAAAARRKALSGSNAATSVEQWAVNKAAHYNAWANFGKKDFAPVVAAFKELLDSFRREDCQSWLYVTPAHGTPDALRCQCNAINMTLKAKSK